MGKGAPGTAEESDHTRDGPEVGASHRLPLGVQGGRRRSAAGGAGVHWGSGTRGLRKPPEPASCVGAVGSVLTGLARRLWPGQGCRETTFRALLEHSTDCAHTRTAAPMADTQEGLPSLPYLLRWVLA